MKLIFLGTRGNIEARAPRHRRHSSLMVVHAGRRILIDCGADWLGGVSALRPDAIVLTHAHPDHAGGLAAGAPAPVHATRATLRAIRGYPIAERVAIKLRRPVDFDGVTLEAFRVAHSVRAPAVGYRITTDGRALFYVPDLVSIRNRRQALAGVDLYIGDGASLVRPLVRRRGHALIGHAATLTQLEWCARERVRRAIFTHCGTGIVTAPEAEVADRVRRLGDAVGVQATIAWDGFELVLR